MRVGAVGGVGGTLVVDEGVGGDEGRDDEGRDANAEARVVVSHVDAVA